MGESRAPADGARKRQDRGDDAATVIRSYEPVEPQAPGVRPHTLILGTMPSAESLRQQEYYAHPRNAFWTIVGDVLGFDRTATPYAERQARLADAGYLLWDVLHSCRRPGSLDADIVEERPNDIAGLLARHPSVARIVFNGQSAAQFFRRHVLPELQAPRHALALQWPGAAPPPGAAPSTLRRIQLAIAPSTSPAYTVPYAEKLAAWRLAVFSPHASP